MSQHRAAHRLGRRIRELRLAQNRTQSDVAGCSGFSAKYLSEIEAGAREALPLSTIEAVAGALSVDIADLFTGPKRRQVRERAPLPGNIEQFAFAVASLPPVKRRKVMAAARAALKVAE